MNSFCVYRTMNLFVNISITVKQKKEAVEESLQMGNFDEKTYFI